MENLQMKALQIFFVERLAVKWESNNYFLF